MAGLKHYGILGMRWGKRKGGQTVNVGPGVRGKLKELGGLTKDALKDDLARAKGLGTKLGSAVKANLKKSEPSKDFTVANQLKKKPIAKLSNEELKTVINRLQLEKQFKDLNKVQVGRGKGIVSKILLNVGAKAFNVYAGQRVDPNFVSIFEQMRKQAQSK